MIGKGRRTMDRNRRGEEEMKGRKEEYSIRYNSIIYNNI